MQNLTVINSILPGPERALQDKKTVKLSLHWNQQWCPLKMRKHWLKISKQYLVITCLMTLLINQSIIYFRHTKVKDCTGCTITIDPPYLDYIGTYAMGNVFKAFWWYAIQLFWAILELLLTIRLVLWPYPSRCFRIYLKWKNCNLNWWKLPSLT